MTKVDSFSYESGVQEKYPYWRHKCGHISIQMSSKPWDRMRPPGDVALSFGYILKSLGELLNTDG